MLLLCWKGVSLSITVEYSIIKQNESTSNESNISITTNAVQVVYGEGNPFLNPTMDQVSPFMTLEIGSEIIKQKPIFTSHFPLFFAPVSEISTHTLTQRIKQCVLQCKNPMEDIVELDYSWNMMNGYFSDSSMRLLCMIQQMEDILSFLRDSMQKRKLHALQVIFFFLSLFKILYLELAVCIILSL